MASRNTAILAIRIVSNSDNAVRAIRKLQRNVAAVQRDFNRLGQTGFTRAVNGIGRMAAMGAVLTGAITSAGAAIGALAAGAVAASVAIGPALIAMALGFEGIKNAAKAIQPQFDALKTAISGVFERELAPGMQLLGNLMDTLTGSMMNLASVISTEFNLFMGVLDASSGKLQTLIQGSGEFVAGFGIGIRSLTQGLIDFGAAAQPAMGAFGEALGRVLGVVGEVLTRFSEMGKVPALMEGVSAVFNGFADLLGSVLTVVLDLVAAMGPSLGEAFTSIGSALEAISPALAEFGEQFAVVLVDAIQALLPHLPSLVESFGRVLDILTQLLPIIGPLAGFIARNADVFMVLAVALKVVTIAMAALNFVLMLNPWTLLAIAIVAVIAVIYLIATRTTWFQTIWETMCTGLQLAWDFVVNALQTAWNTLWTVITTVVQVAITVITTIIQAWVTVVTTIWNVIKTVASTVWNIITTVIQTAINVATTVINAFKSAAEAVWNGIKSVAETVWNAIKSAIETAMNIAKGAIDRFKSAGTTAFNVVKGAVNGVKNAIDWLVGAIRNVISWIGRIRFPSPPGWMSNLFGGFGAAEFTFQPANAMRFVPDAYQAFAARGPELTAAASFGPVGSAILGGMGGNNTTNVTNVNITVEGAIDPVGTANQIRKLLGDTDKRVGVGITARW